MAMCVCVQVMNFAIEKVLDLESVQRRPVAGSPPNAA